MRLKNLVSIAVISACLCNCGGGGGGNSGSGAPDAAKVELTLDPHRTDTGERVSVSTRISDINPLGIILKYRFPKGLQYIRNSASLSVGLHGYDSGPLISVEEGDLAYLVFFFSPESFRGMPAATLTFSLNAAAAASGAVEVDADVDDPAIRDEKEFDPANPKFSEEDSEWIEVDDGRSSGSSSSSSSSSAGR